MGCEPTCLSRISHQDDYLMTVPEGLDIGNLESTYRRGKELMQVTPHRSESDIGIIRPLETTPYNVDESDSSLDPNNFSVNITPGGGGGASWSGTIDFEGVGVSESCNINSDNEDTRDKYFVKGLFPTCGDDEECLNFNISYNEGEEKPYTLEQLRDQLPTDIFQGDPSADDIQKYKDSLYYFRGFMGSDGRYNVEGQIRCNTDSSSRYGCAIIEDGVIRTLQTPMDNTTCDAEANDWSDNFTRCAGMASDKCTSRYGVDENNNVYYSSSDPVENFVQVATNLKQVAADGEHGATLVCGLNSSGSLFCNDNPTTANLWRRVGPPERTLEHITVDNGKVYGVDTEHNLWYYPNTDSDQQGQLHTHGSTYKFKQIDADGNSICGVCSGDAAAQGFNTNNIYCSSAADNITRADTWSNFPGSLTQVTVGRYGNIHHVYGFSGNRVYKSRIGVGGGTFDPHGTQNVDFKQIDFNGSTICGITSGNCIYCTTVPGYDDEPGWVKMKGSLKNISLGSTGS